MAQLHCDVTIMRLSNLDFALPHGELFVRYYVPIGGGRRIRIDTRPINPSTSKPNWDEKATLECRGSGSSIASEVIGARAVIVFELRWRRKIGPVWGKMVRSKLLGRAEVAWRDAANLDDISVEKWVGLGEKSGRSELGLLKPLALLVKLGIRVKVSEEEKKMVGRRERLGKEYCNCSESCGWVGSEEDMFLAASMIDAL